jgi:hypothetical protein
MQTLYVVVALAGSVAGNIPERPNWKTDYFEARASSAGKPLAVFLASGRNGWEKVVRDGLDPNAARLLKEKYTCVFVDTDSRSGADLASAFAVNGRGLIISDRTGDSQQFHHSGELSAADLRKALERYSDPGRRFVATETLAQINPPPAPTYQYQPQIQNYQPQYQNPYYAPAIRLSGG